MGKTGSPPPPLRTWRHAPRSSPPPVPPDGSAKAGPPPLRSCTRGRRGVTYPDAPPPLVSRRAGVKAKAEAGVRPPPPCVHGAMPPGRQVRAWGCGRCPDVCGWWRRRLCGRGCRRMQTDVTLSRKMRGCGHPAHYLVYLASVFNMLSNVYEINPKSVGNPHDLGSAEPTTNNNKTQTHKTNAASMGTHGYTRARVAHPTGGFAPNTGTLVPTCLICVCVVVVVDSRAKVKVFFFFSFTFARPT